MFKRILLDPQGGEGNGGNNQGNGQVVKADLSTVANGLLQKQGGDPIRVINKLLKENYGYRDELRDIKGKLPGEGAVVLSGDDAKLWDSYKTLGPDPKAIKSALDAGTEATTRLGEIERDSAYSKAAKASSYNEPLFKRLAAQDKLSVAVEEVVEQGTGKKVDRAFVLDEKGAKTPLSDYAKAKWGDLLPALGGSQATPKRVGNSIHADDNAPLPNPGERGQADVVKALGPKDRYSV
jgi:hypothetical protein